MKHTSYVLLYAVLSTSCIKGDLHILKRACNADAAECKAAAATEAQQAGVDLLAPSLDALASQVTKENKSVVLNLTVSDPQGQKITLSGSSSDQSLVPDANITFSAIVDNKATVTVRPATNKSGGVTIRVVASNGAKETVQKFDITFNGRTWVHPTAAGDRISPTGGGSMWNLLPAINDTSAIISYIQTDGAALERTYRSTYNNSTWTNPSSITDSISPTTFSTKNLAIGTNSKNEYIISYGEMDGVTGDQFLRHEYRNGTWINPANAFDDYAPDGGQSANGIRIAMNSKGDAVMVWDQLDGTMNAVYKSEYRNGVWVNPSNLADNYSDDSQHAQIGGVVMDDNGNTVIVWAQPAASSFTQLYKSEYRNGAWTHANYASPMSFNSNHIQTPVIAGDSKGNVIIVWVQSDGTRNQVFKSEYRNGAWSHPSSLLDNISPDATAASAPAVAMSEDGSAIITWQQSNGANTQIFKSEYRNGTWTHPATNTADFTPNGANASASKVAMDANGNAVIVWLQPSGGFTNVMKSDYRNGAWTHPTALTQFVSVSGANCSMLNTVMSPSGDALITWMQNNAAYKSELR